MRLRSNLNYALLLGVLLSMTIVGCKKDPYSLPVAKNMLQNDAIKRSIGPNVAGLSIEFAYALALPKALGKLTSVEVVASIPGAAGTFLEHRSFSTNGSGVDVPVVVGSPSVTDGAKTTVNFTVDTFAATLRYYYVVPDAAKAQSVSFTFTGKANNGETVTYQLGPYAIAKMDMKRLITVSDGNLMYISIADMAVYNAAGAAANASKIDLVYAYRGTLTGGLVYNHSLVAPAADPKYLPTITLPTGVNRDIKLRKVFNLQDFHLAQLQFGIYIDDRDFQELNLTDGVNYGINLVAESGVWVETADGKYRAYIYINSINNTARTAVISIKRYAL